MNLEVDINFDLNNFQFDKVVEIGLTNSLNSIQHEARGNAPYESWNLRRSIATEKGGTSGRVWPRSIQYAVKREYENFKNPHTKFYMARAWEKGQEIAKREFDEAVKIVINSTLWAS
jgi:hypothetical protein